MLRRHRSSHFRASARRFCEQLLGGQDAGERHDSVWDLADAMSISRDPLAIIAAVPVLRDQYWQTSTWSVSTEMGDHVKHSILGVSQQDLGAFVCESLRTGAAAAASGTSALVVITDAGQDLDDEMAFVLSRALHAAQHIELKGVVATLAPARARARLVRGTLDELGFDTVPVGIGTDGGFTKYSSAGFEKTSSSYIAPDDDAFSSIDGLDVLVRLYEAAPAGGLDLLVIASLKDVALFVRAHESLFVANTRSLTIMGGVLPFNNSVEGGADDADDDWLVPDTAHNNEFCRESAAFVYRRCQELGVPLIIVSREAAYCCPMPRSIYDDMAKTNHPIGKRLRDTQRDSIESLWKRACSPNGPDRVGLPARCDKDWYACVEPCGHTKTHKSSHFSRVHV